MENRGIKPGLLRSLVSGAVPKSTLEPSDFLVFGVGAAVARRAVWPGRGPATRPSGLPGAPRGGRAAVSRARREWRRAWRGWARGPAAAEPEVWPSPGTATPTAGEAATTPTTPPPPPPEATTGRPGPKASSCLSGMQVLPVGGRKPGTGWG